MLLKPQILYENVVNMSMQIGNNLFCEGKEEQGNLWASIIHSSFFIGGEA